MIALLRAASFLANVVVFAGVPYLLGAGWSFALALACALFALSWWACGLLPRCETAERELVEAVNQAAQRMGAPPPRFVRTLPEWTAAAVRAGRGYGILLGREVAAEHRLAVLAHEIAHFVGGDLFWEPFTDGPGRLLLQGVRKVPPLVVIAVPFLVFAAPLARATELRADRLAADAVPSYPVVLHEVASRMGAGATLLYPSLGLRVRRSAQDSSTSGVPE